MRSAGTWRDDSPSGSAQAMGFVASATERSSGVAGPTKDRRPGIARLAACGAVCARRGADSRCDASPRIIGAPLPLGPLRHVRATQRAAASAGACWARGAASRQPPGGRVARGADDPQGGRQSAVSVGRRFMSRRRMNGDIEDVCVCVCWMAEGGGSHFHNQHWQDLRMPQMGSWSGA